MSGSGRHDIILFSTADWAAKYWTNKQHMAARLAARGHRVLYVETVGLRQPGLNAIDAARIASRLRRGLGPIRKVRDNLWTLSPLTIPFRQGSAAVAAINSWQLRTRIARWMSAHRIETPWIWTYHPYMLDAAPRTSGSKLVYHCVDDLGAVPGVDHAAFAQAERRLIERADVIFTTSHHLQARCAALAGARAHYFGNVADIDHFAAARTVSKLPPDLAGIPGPRLGYVGALSDFKIDFDLLNAVLAHHPDWQLVLIGEEREGQHDPALARLARLSNVHLLGWKPYRDLPGYLAGFDVALLPQRINDYTRAMFPMKFFEYLAAGLPVVSTPLDALRELSRCFTAAATPLDFAAAIEKILANRPAPLALEAPVLRQNSWDHRLDAMLRIVESQVGETSDASARGSAFGAIRDEG